MHLEQRSKCLKLYNPSLHAEVWFVGTEFHPFGVDKISSSWSLISMQSTYHPHSPKRMALFPNLKSIFGYTVLTGSSVWRAKYLPVFRPSLSKDLKFRWIDLVVHFCWVNKIITNLIGSLLTFEILAISQNVKTIFRYSWMRVINYVPYVDI